MKVVFIGRDLKFCSIYECLMELKQDIVAVIGNKERDKENKYRSVHDREFVQELIDLKPDLAVCTYYSHIFKKNFLNIFPKGCINIHPAPLPKYRGNLPIMSAIRGGEKKFGVTIHYMDEGIDSGDIIAQKEVKIEEDDTGYDLGKKSELALCELFMETFPLIEQGKNKRIPQDHKKMIMTKTSDFNNREVDLSWDGEKIYNFVRALTWPSSEHAYIKINDKKIYLTTRIKSKID